MHSHAHSHAHPATARAGRALLIALVANGAFTLAEAAAGLATGSLALLADAGHNLSDVLSLAVAVAAARLALRAPTPNRSFGWKRAEVLAALVNAVALVVVAVLIIVAAVGRLQDPPDVPGGVLAVVAAIGIVVNLGSALLVFRAGGGKDLNARAAIMHLAADGAASLGVLVAGLVIVATGWELADPLVSILIGLLMIPAAWSVLRDATLVLLEAAPRGVDAETVGRRMASVPGVREVHDLHVWEITSGFPALSAHVLVGPDEDCHAVRGAVAEVVAHDFGIAHTTLQVEHAGRRVVTWTGREPGR